MKPVMAMAICLLLNSPRGGLPFFCRLSIFYFCFCRDSLVLSQLLRRLCLLHLLHLSTSRADAHHCPSNGSPRCMTTSTSFQALANKARVAKHPACSLRPADLLMGRSRVSKRAQAHVACSRFTTAIITTHAFAPVADTHSALCLMLNSSDLARVLLCHKRRMTCNAAATSNFTPRLAPRSVLSHVLFHGHFRLNGPVSSSASCPLLRTCQASRRPRDFL
jgi:hypothetical protein